MPMLPVPGYIKASGIQNDSKIVYRWDDWNAQETYNFEFEDDDLFEQIERLSHRAALAFNIGCAEWIVHRYDKLTSDRTIHEYLEASWAAVMDDRYLVPWDLPPEEWSGPIRGPMSVAVMILQEAVRAAVHEDSLGVTACYLINLANHVLPSKKAFSDWMEKILDRLEKLYPVDNTETLGEVVPREALDPNFAFKPDMTEQLIKAYFSKINHATNKHLNSPKEMEQLHFYGKPYQFDIQEEREERRSW